MVRNCVGQSGRGDKTSLPGAIQRWPLPVLQWSHSGCRAAIPLWTYLGAHAMNPLSVSGLTTHIVMLFERDETLRDVAVLGEVSNWKKAASGHVYFSLKDTGATISAVIS